jgi:hypothetical protein
MLELKKKTLLQSNPQSFELHATVHSAVKLPSLLFLLVN